MDARLQLAIAEDEQPGLGPVASDSPREEKKKPPPPRRPKNPTTTTAAPAPDVQERASLSDQQRACLERVLARAAYERSAMDAVVEMLGDAAPAGWAHVDALIAKRQEEEVEEQRQQQEALERVQQLHLRLDGIMVRHPLDVVLDLVPLAVGPDELDAAVAYVNDHLVARGVHETEAEAASEQTAMVMQAEVAATEAGATTTLAAPQPEMTAYPAEVIQAQEELFTLIDQAQEEEKENLLVVYTEPMPSLTSMVGLVFQSIGSEMPEDVVMQPPTSDVVLAFGELLFGCPLAASSSAEVYKDKFLGGVGLRVGDVINVRLESRLGTHPVSEYVALAFCCFPFAKEAGERLGVVSITNPAYRTLPWLVATLVDHTSLCLGPPKLINLTWVEGASQDPPLWVRGLVEGALGNARMATMRAFRQRQPDAGAVIPPPAEPKYEQDDGDDDGSGGYLEVKRSGPPPSTTTAPPPPQVPSVPPPPPVRVQPPVPLIDQLQGGLAASSAAATAMPEPEAVPDHLIVDPRVLCQPNSMFREVQAPIMKKFKKVFKMRNGFTEETFQLAMTSGPDGGGVKFSCEDALYVLMNETIAAGLGCNSALEFAQRQPTIMDIGSGFTGIYAHYDAMFGARVTAYEKDMDSFTASVRCAAKFKTMFKGSDSGLSKGRDPLVQHLPWVTQPPNFIHVNTTEEAIPPLNGRPDAIKAITGCGNRTQTNVCQGLLLSTGPAEGGTFVFYLFQHKGQLTTIKECQMLRHDESNILTIPRSHRLFKISAKVAGNRRHMVIGIKVGMGEFQNLLAWVEGPGRGHFPPGVLGEEEEIEGEEEEEEGGDWIVDIGDLAEPSALEEAGFGGAKPPVTATPLPTPVQQQPRPRRKPAETPLPSSHVKVESIKPEAEATAAPQGLKRGRAGTVSRGWRAVPLG